MAICMATGQAAGIAAALSIKDNVTPRELHALCVRETLEGMSVADAAYTVGFNSQSTYISAFKKYMGCLPSEYSSSA